VRLIMAGKSVLAVVMQAKEIGVDSVSKKSEQIRLRIRLSVAAYSYEYKDKSIMSDAEFDRLSYLVDTSITTGNRKMDNFFKKHFEPATGMWVRKHPDKSGLENIYHRIWKDY
jgi:hypothetical protein